ncbi:hypothetical protein [Streptomyces iconiensis]|uniref:Uncharacterized protein n=1 Tax=Streptomyces iconiensis TaxID=1384038 RepID=A0ABT6ZP66_9ACTN|nr:hypothetical protein [Streptomyces iconiensis]MDJ1130848.1 hypothetical protein [Streptomyces iconiensis]
MGKNDITGQEERNDDKGGSGGEGRTKRLDLSFAQVMGSAVAAVIAAFLAGQLNVYGTFLGAGVVSLVATSGGPIFQHFFRRTGEQIKEVAVPPKTRTRQLPLRDPAAGWKDDSGLDATQAMRGTGQVPGAEPAGHTQATRLIPTAPREGDPAFREEDREGGGEDEARRTEGERAPDQVQMLDTSMVTRMLPGARGAEGGHGSAGEAADATRLLGTVDGPGGTQVPEDKLPGSDEFTHATVHGTRWRGWKRTLLPALVVFVIAIGGVTLYEAISGHNVSGGKGTSISDVFRPGGGSSGDSPDAPPATPDPGQSQDGDDGSTGGHDGSDGQSPDPGATPGEHGGKGNTDSGSGDKEGSTPTPEQSTPQRPGGTGDPDETGKPGDSSGSGDQQDGTDSGSGTGQDHSGTGEGGQFPQRQQNGPTQE